MNWLLDSIMELLFILFIITNFGGCNNGIVVMFEGKKSSSVRDFLKACVDEANMAKHQQLLHLRGGH